MPKPTQTGMIQLNESPACPQAGIPLHEILDILYDAGGDPMALEQVRQVMIGHPGRPSGEISIPRQR